MSGGRKIIITSPHNSGLFFECRKYEMDKILFKLLTEPLIKKYVEEQPILFPQIKRCEYCHLTVKDPRTETRLHQFKNEYHIKHHCKTCREVVFDASRIYKKHINPQEHK